MTRFAFPYGAGGSLLRRMLAAIFAMLLLLALAKTSQAANLQVRAAGSVFPQHALEVSGSGLGPLTAARVHVVENGAPVPALTVRSLRHASGNDFGVVLVIDVSPNVSSIEHAVAAARGLAAQRPPRGMLGIVEADAFPSVALPLTRDSGSIHLALATAPVISRHGLHVYDAVLAGLGMLRSAKIAAGSVVVLTDGADRGEPATLRQIATIANAGHLRIFSVGIASPRFNAQPLRSLAVVSGGQFVEARSKQLSGIFGALGSSLSNAYLVRYLSSQAAGRRVAASMRIDGIPGAYDISYVPPAVAAGVITPPSLKHTTFWTSTTGALLMSIACALLLGFAVLTVMRRRETVRARVGGFVTTDIPDAASNKQRTLVQRALGDVRLRRRERSPWLDALVLELDIARIDISPLRLALLTVAGTVFLAWLLVSATASPLAVIVALALPFAVLYVVRFLANRQRRAFEEQLPDNLGVIASALRAGHTFIGALGIMVENAPEPSRRELRRALADEQLGVPLAATLEQVSIRMRSSDFQQVTLVATLQRDTGGNTAEVLDVVTDTVRDRLDIRRLIRSLTAQGRLAGGILCGLPVALLIAVSLINPSYTHPLFHKGVGILALALAVVMVISGTLIIRRIVNIEV